VVGGGEGDNGEGGEGSGSAMTAEDKFLAAMVARFPEWK
jgi:hypothetical protein